MVTSLGLNWIYLGSDFFKYSNSPGPVRIPMKDRSDVDKDQSSAKLAFLFLMDYRHESRWTVAHFSRLLKEFQMSVAREPLIPAGAPLNYVPKASVARAD